jgi:general secretion pathway protein J
VVEALATLALSALLLGALISLSAGLFRVGDKVAAKVETLEIDGRTIAALAREFRMAAPLRWAGEGDNRAFVFGGTPDRIMFALTPEQPSGLRAAIVVLYQRADNGDLLRAEGPLPVGASTLAEVELGPVSRIPRGADDLRLAYVGRAPGGGEIVADDWSNPKDMPAAIRIDRIERGAGTRLASLRVPLLMDAEPGCADPQQGLCSRVPRKAKPAGQEEPPPGAGARTGPTPSNAR